MDESEGDESEGQAPQGESEAQTPTAAELQRVTLAYDETEDRISLTGLAEDETVQVIWLTRRLLDRLVPHLCQWLEAQAPEGGTGRPTLASAHTIAHTMAQQRAVSALAGTPQQPVQRDATTRCWLASVVDIRAMEQAMSLQLRTHEASPRARLTLHRMVLRQWLAILLQQYGRADWPLAPWPAWLLEASTDSSPQEPLLLH